MDNEKGLINIDEKDKALICALLTLSQRKKDIVSWVILGMKLTDNKIEEEKAKEVI